MARPFGDILAEQNHLSRRDRIDTGDEVKQCGLAGSIRADDRLAITRHDAQRDVARGLKPAEAFAQCLELERRDIAAVRLSSAAHADILRILERNAGAVTPGPGALSLFAVLARREVAAIDRLSKEFVLAVSPELADVRIRLDDRIPELRFVVAEHLLLLDLLDVDALDGVTFRVHAD